VIKISVSKNIYCNDLAEVPAYVGELNQVWTNIIDNAIYALDNNGVIIIETTCDAKNVYVKIIDNGPGIPEKFNQEYSILFLLQKKLVKEPVSDWIL
jgi:signal transduction histidine kinase